IAPGGPVRLAIVFRSLGTVRALFVRVPFVLAVLLLASPPSTPARTDAPIPGHFDVRSFGAKGDGRTLDTEAINRAITAAHEAGGGTVHFPAGTYLSVSIHLQSHVGLALGSGAVLEAAAPTLA